MPASAPRSPRLSQASRGTRVLQALAEAPAGLTTGQITDLFGENMPTRAAAMSRYGTLLRAHERDGSVVLAGKVPGGYRRGPANVWRVTDKGLTRLAAWEAGHRQTLQTATRAARLIAEHGRAAAYRQGLLATARTDYGPATAAAVRRQLVPELRAAGCTLAEIGQAFGVSREQIRQDDANGPAYRPRRRVMIARAARLAARNRALDRLAAEWPDRFAVLLKEETAAAGGGFA